MSLLDTEEIEKEEAEIQEAKRIQKKFTIVMACLFFVEIMPLPFTAFISLYTVRKRPDWLPDTVQSLYADIPANDKEKLAAVNPAKTKKKVSITIICMMLVDLGPIPLTIPVGIYIVRRRPKWFRNVVERLYADITTSSGPVAIKRVRLYDD
jgi:ABC-type phosphate transport system permease subunit